MRLFEIQEVIQKQTEKIKDKVIPVVTEKIMDSFYEGFECGMDIGCSVIRDTTTDWLYEKLHEGSISVSDMEKLIGEYKYFIEKQRRIKEKTK